MTTATLRTSDSRERGMALVAVLSVSVPMIVLVGAAASTMLRRNDGLMRQVVEEHAFQAAEAGLDAALYRARVNLLRPDVEFGAEVGAGSRYDARPVYWKSDRVDNDGDGAIDEADEDILVVQVTGSSGNTTRRLSASFVLGRGVPFGIPSPIYFEPSEKLKLKIKGSKDDDGIRVSGLDRNIDGSRPANPIDVPAVTVSSETAEERLENKLKPKATKFIEGIGLIEVRDISLDIDALAAHVEAHADFYAERKDFPEVFGDSSRGEYRVTHCDGKVSLNRNYRGAGVLVVDGELKAGEDFAFDGLIIVRGKLELKKNAKINGAVVVLGKKLDKNTGEWVKASVSLSNDTTLQYSTEALTHAAQIVPSGLLPRPDLGGSQAVQFTAWRGNYARSGYVAGR